MQDLKNKAGFIPHLHAFRGFAILNIVGAHAWSLLIFNTGGLDNAPDLAWLFHITETLFHGSTLYFALISGLLFSLVLHAKPWASFYRSKALNVFLPYAVLTIGLTALYWRYYLEGAERNGNDIAFVPTVLENLLMGRGDLHFWYMPVLFVLYGLTPVLMAILKQPKLWWLTWLLMAAPLIVSRSPFPDFLKPQTFVYFTGAYMAGLFWGQHYDKVMDWVERYWQSLLIVTLAISVTITALYRWDQVGGGLPNLHQSLVYMQKAALAALVLLWLRRSEGKLPKSLMTLGTYAFAIYFLHLTFVYPLLGRMRDWLGDSRRYDTISAFGLLNFIVAVAGSLAFAGLLKWLLKRHSRKLVGV